MPVSLSAFGYSIGKVCLHKIRTEVCLCISPSLSTYFCLQKPSKYTKNADAVDCNKMNGVEEVNEIAADVIENGGKRKKLNISDYFTKRRKMSSQDTGESGGDQNNVE